MAGTTSSPGRWPTLPLAQRCPCCPPWTPPAPRGGASRPTGCGPARTWPGQWTWGPGRQPTWRRWRTPLCTRTSMGHWALGGMMWEGRLEALSAAWERWSTAACSCQRSRSARPPPPSTLPMGPRSGPSSHPSPPCWRSCSQCLGEWAQGEEAPWRTPALMTACCTGT